MPMPLNRLDNFPRPDLRLEASCQPKRYSIVSARNAHDSLLLRIFTRRATVGERLGADFPRLRCVESFHKLFCKSTRFTRATTARLAIEKLRERFVGAAVGEIAHHLVQLAPVVLRLDQFLSERAPAITFDDERSKTRLNYQVDQLRCTPMDELRA